MINTPDIFSMWQDRPAKGGESKRFLPSEIYVRSRDTGEATFAEDGEGIVYDITVSWIEVNC
jgi:hypothetical protein